MSNFVFALSLALTLSGEPAVQADVLTPARVARLRSVSAAVLSPQGDRVAYTLSVPREPMVDEDGGPWSELHLLDLATDDDRTFVGGKAGVSQLRFSPDGRSLLFVEKRAEDKSSALYTIALDGGEARRAARIEGGISAYSISPDGARVAVISTEPESATRKKASEKGFKQEVYEEDVRPGRVFVLELLGENKAPKPFPVEGSVNQVHWSPAGDQLALAVAPSALVDDEMMESRIQIVDAASGKTLARLENPGKLGQIAWSPDGAFLACVSAADVHDTAAGRLFCAPASGGAFTDLIPAYAGHVEKIAWLDSRRIAYVAAQGVWSVVGSVGAPGTGIEPSQLLGPGGPVLTDLTASRDGATLALVGSTPTQPPACFTLRVGEVAAQRRTRANPELDALRFALQEVVRFKARDGLELEGVLIRPLDEKPGTRYPLILNVHGGPESCQSNGWLTGYSNPGQVAAARGFSVFHVNYRGSTGRGVEFAKSSQGDAAGKEFDDLVDAADHLIATGLVDPKKVGVTGGSYGGYATAWLSTKHTERFAAGVMFVGISDKISKVGTTDIADEEYLVHARKRPWEDWQHLLERSPIYHAEKSRTPLLILHGKDDPRVNPGQSRELYRHLKMHGKTPVRLVLYPGEGHGNRKAASRYDYNLRMLQWFEHYLQGPGGEMPPHEIDYTETLAVQ